MAVHEKLEERCVEVADPSLSPEANRRLTKELRQAVGTDTVRVPVQRPHPSRGEPVGPRGGIGVVGVHRALWIGSLAAVLTLGAMLSLITGSWWFLPLAAGVHAVGTLSVATVIARLTGIVENPGPSTVALLEAEGVREPQEYFSRLVSEFAVPEPGEPATGPEERTMPAGEEPSVAAVQQRSAVTPTSGASRPVGFKGLPELISRPRVQALLVGTVVTVAMFCAAVALFEYLH